MARFNAWPTNAAPGVVRIADAEPDSGSSALQATNALKCPNSRALQATPLQAPFLDPNRFSKSKIVDEFEERSPCLPDFHRGSFRVLPFAPLTVPDIKYPEAFYPTFVRVDPKRLV